MDDLNYLNTDKNNLKYIASVRGKLQWELCPFFGVVIYSNGILQMAVDINTMNSSRLYM